MTQNKHTSLEAVERFFLNFGKVVIRIGIVNHNIAPIMCTYSLN